MDKQRHHIDQLFGPGLEGYEELPSAAYFQRMEAALDEMQEKSGRKRLAAWRKPVLLTMLLLSGLAIYEAQIVDNKKNISGQSVFNKTQSTDTGDDAIVKDLPAMHQPEKNKQGLWMPNKNASINLHTSGRHNDAFTISQTSSFHKNIASGNFLFEEKSKQIRLPFDALSNYGFPQTVNANALLNKTINNREPLLQLTTTKDFDSVKNVTGKKQKHHKLLWELSPFISYEQAGYNLESDAPLAVNRIKFSEAHEPSFSGGLLLSRSVTKKLSLQTGLSFQHTAVGMKPQKVYAFTDPTGNVAFKYITSSGYAYFTPKFGTQPIVGDSLTTAEGKHILQSINLPLLLRYTAVDKRFYVKTLAGIEASFITKANLEVDIEDPTNKEIVQVKRLSGVNTVYWSFVAGGEIGYRLNKKLSLNVRPVYRVALSPITKNNVVETYPKSFGIGAGISIRF